MVGGLGYVANWHVTCCSFCVSMFPGAAEKYFRLRMTRSHLISDMRNMLAHLRQSQWWRELTDDQISPTADLLPSGWRSPRRFAIGFAAFVAFLICITWLLGSEFVPFAQWVFYFIVLTVLPGCALDYTRWRWGPTIRRPHFSQCRWPLSHWLTPL